jgi:hypothetical protein
LIKLAASRRHKKKIHEFPKKGRVYGAKEEDTAAMSMT